MPAGKAVRQSGESHRRIDIVVVTPFIKAVSAHQAAATNDGQAKGVRLVRNSLRGLNSGRDELALFRARLNVNPQRMMNACRWPAFAVRASTRPVGVMFHDGR